MGVDLDEVRGGDGGRFRAQHGIDGPVVTFMGAVTDDKGAVHLLRAMQRLWRNGSKVDLIIAGQTVAPSTFERVYDGLPAAHRMRIRRMGPVGGQLKQDMLAATDLFVLPSRVDSFGIVYLEAWAYGVPVIGCQAGGVPEVIEGGQDGLLVPFGDEDALAAAIEALLVDPDRRRTMGEQGRAKVKAGYTWDQVYHRLLAAYNQLVVASLPATRTGAP
jgi:glycosyltransferase involved in cell wall biosynthesis